MKCLLTLIEFFAGLFLIFVIGRFIAHLFKIDEYFNCRKG